jgi:hypothetical protein
MSDVPPDKKNLPSPKRGALPTPQWEIEQATPYDPKRLKGDRSVPQTSSPADTDQTKKDSGGPTKSK